jgi:hypothetical protein
MSDLIFNLEQFAKRTIFNLSMNKNIYHTNYEIDLSDKIDVSEYLKEFNYSIDAYVSSTLKNFITVLDVTMKDFKKIEEPNEGSEDEEFYEYEIFEFAVSKRSVRVQ